MDKYKLVAALLAGFCIGLSPWIARNLLIYRRFILSTNAGEVFYIAHNANYHFGGESVPLPSEKQKQARGLSDDQIGGLFGKEGWDYCKSHPWLTLESTLINMLVFWRPTLTPGVFPLVQNIVYTAFNIPLLAFFLYGILSIRKASHYKEWMLILAVMTMLFLVHIPFYIVNRFREHMSPLIILTAVFGFLQWRKTLHV